MTKSSKSEPVPSFDDASDGSAGNIDREDLQVILTILRLISAAGRGDPLHPEHRAGLESWEDDSYVYFGADMPDAGRDIDINVHEGQLMVRLEKRS